ncbi:hypothetical protein DNTS_014561 [Danionella cerebrum]|uniref:L1 transposable element RRM domain-containing protein n=1 Tax=Danionella cerebrum TaxID=2873325 RepID=A0A553MPZ0_9TELE|nr:hypothetical protein DNTS_014561 [Danionella translucida]
MSSELAPERQSAKDESSTIDGSALMAAIKTLEAGIHQKFDAHAAEFRKEILSLREEMHNSMVAVTSDVKAHEERLCSLESATSEWTTSLQVLAPTVASLQNEFTALRAKCLDLQCRSRRSNIHLLGIAEGSEGPQPTKFVAEALREIFALHEAPLLACTHRALAAKPAEGQRPQAFVICFHRFDVKEDILRKAIQAKQLKFKDKNVHVFPNFPPEMAKKPAAYYDVKRLLRPRSDVKYGLRGLTGFRITYNNAAHIFDSPAEAMTFVKHRIIPD